MNNDFDEGISKYLKNNFFPHDEWILSVTTQQLCNWIVFTYKNNKMPSRGFKLHISSSINNASAIINKVFPILLKEKVNFKLSASLKDLLNLLNGKGGLSQVGKFMTIYPSNKKHFVKIAKAIHLATKGMKCPQIPNERCLNNDSIVYYRYGSFESKKIQLNSGEIVPAIKWKNGVYIKDDRKINLDSLFGIKSPFETSLLPDKTIKNSVLCNRFLVIDKLFESPKASTYVGLDLVADDFTEVVIKISRSGLMIDTLGNDALVRLKKEAAKIQHLSKFKFCPQYIDFIEEEKKSILIYKYKKGLTLGQVIKDFSGKGVVLDEKTIVEWVRKAAKIIETVHNENIIYGDLKPDNIIIDENGDLHLLDFETSHFVFEHPSMGIGTDGYSSPEQVKGLKGSTFEDDVYSLGALLVSLLTTINLSLVEENFDFKSFFIKNPNQYSSEIINLALACIKPDRNERINTLSKFIEALNNCELSSFQDTDIVKTDNQPDEPFLRYAIHIGENTLFYSIKVNEQSITWTTNHIISNKETCRDIYNGASGIGFFLINLYLETNEIEYLKIAEKAAIWLMSTEDKIGRQTPLPGLYFGESGTGLFSLCLWKVTKNKKYLNYAKDRNNIVNKIELLSPDLVAGAAGIGLFNILMYHATNEKIYIERTRKCSDFLYQTCIKEDSGIFWQIPDDFENLSQKKYIGFAHGTSGIGYFLIEAYKILKEERLSVLIKEIANWLNNISLKISYNNEPCLNWETEIGSDKYSLFWCHGATGIGIFFLRMYEVFGDENYLQTAIKAGNSIYYFGKSLGTTICHGLSGNICYLIMLYQNTQDKIWQDRAKELGKNLLNYQVIINDRKRWHSEKYDIVTSDFMIGESGIGDSFLKLYNPDSLDITSFYNFIKFYAAGNIPI